MPVTNLLPYEVRPRKVSITVVPAKRRPASVNIKRSQESSSNGAIKRVTISFSNHPSDLKRQSRVSVDRPPGYSNLAKFVKRDDLSNERRFPAESDFRCPKKRHSTPSIIITTEEDELGFDEIEENNEGEVMEINNICSPLAKVIDYSNQSGKKKKSGNRLKKRNFSSKKESSENTGKKKQSGSSKKEGKLSRDRAFTYRNPSYSKKKGKLQPTRSLPTKFKFGTGARLPVSTSM